MQVLAKNRAGDVSYLLQESRTSPTGAEIRWTVYERHEQDRQLALGNRSGTPHSGGAARSCLVMTRAEGAGGAGYPSDI